jgi:hypothetical protein
MKLYYYSNKNLNFNEIKILFILKLLFLLVVFVIFIDSNTSSRTISNNFLLNKEETTIRVKSHLDYSEEKLIKEINRMNFRFPHIIYAQAILETNNFKSKLFIENNNLFGMKEAKMRNTLALGTQNSYAYYNSWWESLLDFGFWYSSYARKCKTENEYYDLLSKIYAEDPLYIVKTKQIVERIDKNKFIINF